MSEEQVMPVLLRRDEFRRFPKCPRSVPMDLLNEETAQQNHQQSLARLAERGGMAPCEILANMGRRKWMKMDLAIAVKGLIVRCEQHPQPNSGTAAEITVQVQKNIIEAATEDLAALRQRVEELERSPGPVAKENASLRSRLETAEQRVEEWRSAHENAARHLRECADARVKAEARVQELETDRKALGVKVGAERAHADALQGKLEEARNAIRKLCASVENLGCPEGGLDGLQDLIDEADRCAALQD
jgi:DNA repair exonuclease SbcCD ATPase subunit